MDFEDHFTSHKFTNVYWNGFETLINAECPSPECYPTVSTAIHDNDSHETISEDEQPTVQSALQSSIEHEDELSLDEIRIDVNHNGQLIAKTNQVTDYQLRSPALSNLILWDFIAQTEKISTQHAMNIQ